MRRSDGDACFWSTCLIERWCYPSRIHCLSRSRGWRCAHVYTDGRCVARGSRKDQETAVDEPFLWSEADRGLCVGLTDRLSCCASHAFSFLMPFSLPVFAPSAPFSPNHPNCTFLIRSFKRRSRQLMNSFSFLFLVYVKRKDAVRRTHSRQRMRLMPLILLLLQIKSLIFRPLLLLFCCFF